MRYAREHGIPYLGICLGMQIAIIEFGRHVLGSSDANSTEFNRATPASGDRADHRMAGSGARRAAARRELAARAAPCAWARRKCCCGAGTRARELYGRDAIFERHRHRFEFNNNYLDRYTPGGLSFSGFSRDGLVEIIELPGHPWFVATQFHPEFTSTPRDGHPLFTGFVRAARAHRASQLPRRGGRMKLAGHRGRRSISRCS